MTITNITLYYSDNKEFSKLRRKNGVTNSTVINKFYYFEGRKFSERISCSPVGEVHKLREERGSISGGGRDIVAGNRHRGGDTFDEVGTSRDRS